MRQNATSSDEKGGHIMLYISNLTIFDVLGYIGNIVSVIGGIFTAKKLGLHPIIQFLSGISTAFLGDMFFRDIILLHTTPYIFNHPIEIITMVVIDISVIVWMKKKNLDKKFSKVLSIVNPISIVIFAILDYERSISAREPWWFCIVTVWGSICGGEIIAVAIRALGTREWRYFTKTLNENKFYYFFCAVLSVICGCLKALDINNDTALIILTVFVMKADSLMKNKRLIEKGTKTMK